SLMLAGFANAGFEQWTSKDGKSVELELVNVSETDGEKTGVFRMRDGRTVTLAASALADADAERLAAWQPDESGSSASAAAQGAGSVFDKFLDGNLESLEGKSLRRLQENPRPTKYYLFYYT